MTETDARAISTLKKRRGVVRASITRFTKSLRELEGRTDDPNTINLARRLKERLVTLDSEFKEHHRALIDLVDEEEALQNEQNVLDEHDDELSLLTVRVQQLVAACTVAPDPNSRRIASRRLTCLQRSLSPVREAINALPERSDDVCLLRQREEQLSDFKRELQDIRTSLLLLDMEEGDELTASQANLEKGMFDCSLRIKQLLRPHMHTHVSTPSDSKGVRLPKLDVPIFDGNILTWRSFWEQFNVSVHSRSSLSDSEKLVYLQQSLKEGSAKHVIEGLSRSGEHYTEAVECLKARYDRPRLIHQTHVRMILETPNLKDGSGNELRRLHDTVQQHLRALKAMEYEPSGPFITSMLELKLDTNTMFEWQKHSQATADVPHYQKLLEFISLRAQASETSICGNPKRSVYPAKKTPTSGKFVASFAASTIQTGTSPPCVVCKTDKHPLYACTKFKSLAHGVMVSTLKSNRICMNCLRPGHFIRECKSHHRCKKCQKPHHTLLHVEASTHEPEANSPPPPVNSVISNAATGSKSSCLMMTCRVLIDAPDGSSVEARAILDSASTASFVSERISQSLCLPRSHQNAKISGVAGLSHNSPLQAIAHFTISPIQTPTRKFKLAAVVVPRVTCDLPLHPVPFDLKWNHLTNLPLADPDFGRPGRIDLLLGVDVFVEVLCQGRRTGLPGSPSAFETTFGWVVAGQTNPSSMEQHIASHHSSMITGDELLQRFWEVEENPKNQCNFSPEEKSVVQHFKENHRRKPNGRFIVPLPKKPSAKPLGESRSQAVRRFLSLERSLHSKGQFSEFKAVMDEYFEMDHAELVPVTDLTKPPEDVFYLPLHAVRKESSTTTKIRAVFDASAKSTTGISLNDLLLVGPTVHPPLIDVLLRFRFHRIALITDVSRMYRAVELAEFDRDLHRFVWRQTPGEPFKDYRMTRVTFGVSASSFAANMAVKQNAVDLALKFPLAYNAVKRSFYVDDGLSGADSVEEAIELREQLQTLFSRGGFLLRKWNSSEPTVLQHIPADIQDSRSILTISDSQEYTKTLGLEWNAKSDHFHLAVSELPPLEGITKRILVSDISKTYDVLGWFSPSTIKVKILLQRLWELKTEWDDPVPVPIRDAWLQWRSELHVLSTKRILRCYFSKETHISSAELHGFSDASELAYAAVVYIRITDQNGDVQVTLVTSKTKVAPIKRLTIPRLELCGAYILAQLLHHVKLVFDLPMTQVHAWTDSTIVLNWLDGNPRRFKTYVGNRVSCIVELIRSDRWNHVNGTDNPADCASRGLFPSELLDHGLWWNGPEWLKSPSTSWPSQTDFDKVETPEEEREISLHTIALEKTVLIPMDRYSHYSRLRRVTAWILRFVNKCRGIGNSHLTQSNPYLSTPELQAADVYWASVVQGDHFAKEIYAMESKQHLSKSSALLSLHPIVDSYGLLRVGGRDPGTSTSYDKRYPIILSGKHPVTKLIVHSEHIRLLHAGPNLLTCSLNQRYHILGSRRIVRSITRNCVTCRRVAARPQTQKFGHLPFERVTPDLVFDKVGLDYAGPLYIKYGSIRRPTIVKAYVCIFVSLSVKAVHLELVSDLTSEAFIACLRRFISRRGKPTLMWSDHGTNFVGATREIREMIEFLESQRAQGSISNFCSTQNIEWKFIPERAPHFGGLWESAVKSMKTHLKKVVTNTKLTFEEFSTVLAQVEACLNSRPLVSIPADDDGIEALTPGHFLIGRPLETLPDPSFSYRKLSLLRRWHLCQAIVRHFWKRWSQEYLSSLKRFGKWHQPTRNIRIGDIVVLREDNMTPTKWPLARVIEVHPGSDGLVRVVSVKTSSGKYKRPITKVVLLLPTELSDNGSI